jgi:hypothetical protein
LSVNEPNNLFKGKYCLAYFQLKIPDDDVLTRDLKREAHKFEYATNEIDDVIFGLANPLVDSIKIFNCSPSINFSNFQQFFGEFACHHPALMGTLKVA